MPTSVAQFLDQLRSTSILSEDELRALQQAEPPPAGDAEPLAQRLVREKRLTLFQATQLYRGRGESLVLGNYLVLEKLGQGGMGIVYKARHRVMERLVAIKVLPAAMKKDEQAVRRFQREVRAAAQLTHPNIVAAYDADEATGLLYLVMEYVEGVDLSTLLRQRGRLHVREAVDFVLQAAKGLEYAHGMGVIHRDIKPGNLLLSRNGVVKVLDLGLARCGLAGLGEADDDLTRSNQMLGTVDYMAPEQSYDTHQADERSDVYSLGCTLYRLLTGEPPYAGDTAVQRVMAHREAPVPALRQRRGDVPPRLDALCTRMMAKRPEDRPPSMKAVIAELKEIEANLALSSGDAGAMADADSLPALDPVTHMTFVERAFAAPAAAADGLPAASGFVPPESEAARSQASLGSWFGALFRSPAWLSDRRRWWLAGATMALVALAAGWWWARVSSTPQENGGGALAAKAGNDSQRPRFPAAKSAPIAPASKDASGKKSTGSRRVLIVVPRDDYWIPDFEPVRAGLTAAGMEIVVASSQRAIRGTRGSGGPVESMAALTVADAIARASDFDAVYFVGKRGENEFAAGGVNAADARRLIQAMHEQRKIVSALCRGTVVLFDAGALTGRLVARGSFTPEITSDASVNWREEPVVRDDGSGRRLLTGADPGDAQAFARALASMLRGE